MPEGDTIHHAANVIRPVLEGRVPEEIRTPQRRHERDRWPARLADRAVNRVEARGKHLLLHFDGDLVVHSHLRMSGAWAVYGEGERWRRSPRRAWLVLACAGREVVQFDGPLLELLTEARTRSDLRLAGLGQDILGERFDEPQLLARIREDDPTRAVGDALTDQRTLAGIGNIWKSEACFAAALDPYKPLSRTADEELLAAVRYAREHMAQSARDGFAARPRAVYGRAGEACARCGAALRCGGQGEQNRMTYWCPQCQR
jgi:endonuclease VIII